MVKMESHPLAAGTFRTRRWPAYTEASSASQGGRENRRGMKTASRFSKKIMFKQRDDIMIRFGFIESW